MQIALREEIYHKKSINYRLDMPLEEECYVVCIKLIHCQNFHWFIHWNSNPRLKVKGHTASKAPFSAGTRLPPCVLLVCLGESFSSYGHPEMPRCSWMCCRGQVPLWQRVAAQWDPANRQPLVRGKQQRLAAHCSYRQCLKPVGIAVTGGAAWGVFSSDYFTRKN